MTLLSLGQVLKVYPNQTRFNAILVPSGEPLGREGQPIHDLRELIAA